MKRLALYNREEITCILEKGDADDTDTGIILDVDGTFIDSNDAHVKSWAEAMAVYGYNVAFEKVRPLIIDWYGWRQSTATNYPSTEG